VGSIQSLLDPEPSDGSRRRDKRLRRWLTARRLTRPGALMMVLGDRMNASRIWRSSCVMSLLGPERSIHEHDEKTGRGF
jgi:hypothetical protein